MPFAGLQEHVDTRLSTLNFKDNCKPLLLKVSFTSPNVEDSPNCSKVRKLIAFVFIYTLDDF